LPTKTSHLHNRVHNNASEWEVVVERIIETETSVIAFGARNSQSVVLKVIKHLGDEWRSGEVLAAFNSHGVVRVYEHAPGAVLMERVRPGTSLVSLVLNGRDEEATDILADVIQRMSERENIQHPAAEARHPTPKTWHLALESRHPTPGTRNPQPPIDDALPIAIPTAHDWAKGFDRYLASGDEQIPKGLVEAAQQIYLNLAGSQRQPRLLHGDLQHYNILFDSSRGWVAIDPKGVIGEVEYEIGAALRNPVERPELFLSRPVIERRLKQFTNKLDLDFGRVLAWVFAQAVLSAIWEIEDGFEVNSGNPALRLANATRLML
jgi:streptomycin 6-kinase